MQAAILDHIITDGNLTSSKKILMVVLARHALNGQEVYPSLRRLAELSSLSLAHVCTLLPELERSGHLAIRRYQGPKGANLYELNLPTAPASGALVDGAPVSSAPVAGARSTGAPVALPELKPEEKEKQVLVHSLELQPVEHSVHHEATASPRVDPKAEHWLATTGVSPDFHSLCTGAPQFEGEEVAQEVTHPARPPRVRTPRARREPGTAPRRLGKLCPQGHDYEGSGQSMRRWPGGSCVVCDREQQRARALAKNPTPRAHKPYAWKNQPESAPEILTGEEAARHREHRPYTLRLVKAQQHW